ncbi:hypothetical protein FV219_02900 [Methylobacterium sp. WL122]|nr:hypothetical protein FV219_02900 [Methylobacterium sp. WL122]
MPPTRPLSPEEEQRLARKERTLRNRRGRRNPASMPTHLARTSAFAPRKKDLITDSNFVRIYEVPGYSVVEVKGRELGSQHRDAIYALFRLPREKIKADNPAYRTGTFIAPVLWFYQTRTTWRTLIRAMGRTEHVNNLLSLVHVFQEIQQVSVLIHEGRSLKELEAIRNKRTRNILPDGAGSASSLITDLSWEGAQLDSPVTVTYGARVLEMIEKAHLVSINADVQFRLKSDHAKVFWPFIDSQPDHTFIDEERLAQLAGRELWTSEATSATRAQFRKECREAFKDMVSAGGLSKFDEEITGSGRAKARRYTYAHAAPRQCELDLPRVVDAI